MEEEVVNKMQRKRKKTKRRQFGCARDMFGSIDGFFSNRYSAVASPPRPARRVYMSFMEHIYCDSMDLCPKPGKSLLLSFSSSSSSSKFDKDSSLSGMGGRIMVVFRGLILYNVCRKACIYNPTTRQRVILPIVESNIFAQDEFCKNVGYFFGHDPVLDQYKILCTVVISSEKLERITSEHWVLVLEAGGFWKRIEFDQPHAYTRPGLYIDGVVYYLAATSISRDILVSFDVRSEEFGIIKNTSCGVAFTWWIWWKTSYFLLYPSQEKGFGGLMGPRRW